MAEFIRVAGTAEVKPGHGIVAEINGKTIALFNVDGTIHAIDNTCVHRGGPLGEGELEDGMVTCPWHGWQFNVSTGECVKNPSAKVAVYQVKVDGDNITVLI